MKIVMLCDFFNESLEYQENLLTKYYVKHGHQVTIITSTFQSVFDYYNGRHDKRVPSHTYQHHGAKIVKLRYRYNLLNRLRAFTPIDSLLAAEKPDLIYVHDIIPNILEAVRYKRRNPDCRMIFDYHADYSNSGKNWVSLKILHGLLRKWILDRARPHLSAIFPIVPASATFLHEIYGVPYEAMEVLPLGADSDLGNEVAARGEGVRLRAHYGIGDGDTVIFTGGKLTPAKRTELIVEAVNRIGDPRVHLVVVGQASEADSRYAESVRTVAGANANIRFVGWLNKEDIYGHLDLADLAVFPASQSILWQQAISMGLPLIVGDTGHQDISYLNLYDNIVMLRASEITAESIIAELRRLLDDRERLAAMQRGARRVAAEQLDWNQLVERTLRYNQAVPTAAREKR